MTNNFRLKELNSDQLQRKAKIAILFDDLEKLTVKDFLKANNSASGRAMSLFKTKLEEAYLWAERSIGLEE